MPQASAPWALDSGAFTELRTYGRWKTSENEYVEAVERYQAIGRLQWAAPMDWMTEPFMLDRTGLRVEDHQHRTVDNYLRLRDRGPFIPVLQGWTLDDYHRCCDLYDDAGVDLAAEQVVGLGSVCRRQHTGEVAGIVWAIRQRYPSIQLHGFGVKTSGMKLYADALASADSMAWSYDARRADPLPGCTHQNCANCLDYALRWRERLLRSGTQMALV